MKSQEQLREEWHNFFIQNKDRFTDSESEAILDKNKILVEKEINPFKQHGDRTMASEIQYRGTSKFVAFNWKRRVENK